MNYKENKKKKKHGKTLMPCAKTTIDVWQRTLLIHDTIRVSGNVNKKDIYIKQNPKDIVIMTREYELQGAHFHQLIVGVDIKYNDIEKIVDLSNIVRALHWAMLRVYESQQLVQNILSDLKPYEKSNT